MVTGEDAILAASPALFNVEKGPMVAIPIPTDVEATRLSVDWLRIFSDLARHLSHGEELEEFFNHVAFAAARASGCDSALVMWANPAVEGDIVVGRFRLPADYLAHGYETDELSNRWTPVTEAWMTGVPVLVEDMAEEPRLAYWQDSAHRGGVNAIATFPLVTRDMVAGVLSLYFSESHKFTAVEIDAATAIADFAAAAITVSTLSAERAAHVETLERLLADRQRIDAFHRAVTDASLTRQGVAGLVQAAAEATAIPIVVLDADGRRLARSRLDNVDLDDKDPRMERALAMQSVNLGRILMFPSEDDELAQHVLDYIGVAVERELALSAQDELERERVFEDLLEQLLGASSPAEAADAQVRFREHSAALRFPLRISMSKLSEEDSDAATVLLSRTAIALRDRIGSTDTFISRTAGVLLALEPASEGLGIGERVAERLRHQRGKWRSVTFVEVEDRAALQTAVRVGMKLLDLAELSGSESDLVYAERVGLVRLVLESSSAGTIAKLISSIVEPVRTYDERHQGDLYRTLLTCARNDFRAGDTASSLFIHPNTLTYRLSKISGLIGRDVRSLDAMAEVKIAVVLDELLRGGRAGGAEAPRGARPGG